MAAVELRGSKQLKRFLIDLEAKQLPFAEAVALTRTAKDVQSAQRLKMRSVFDRPSRWTLNSLYITPATKRRLTARVWFKDRLNAPKGTPASAYLPPQIDGGGREYKRYEKALHARGLLPRGYYTTPGKGQRLNQYGNITSGRITKVLSGLQSSRDPMQNSTEAAKRNRFFVMYRGRNTLVSDARRPIGIYERTGKRTIKSVLHFTKSRPGYRERYPFHEFGRKVAVAAFPGRFAVAFRDALRTAKR